MRVTLVSICFKCGASFFFALNTLHCAVPIGIVSPTTGGALLLRRNASGDIPRFQRRRCFIKKHESGRTLVVAHTDAVTALNLA